MSEKAKGTAIILSRTKLRGWTFAMVCRVTAAQADMNLWRLVKIV
jgi:hypothetical protein